MEYYPFLRHVCNSYTFFLYDFCLIFFRIILKCLGTNPKQDRLHACHCFKVQLWSLTSHQPSITACCVPDELQMSLRWWWFLWHFCAQPTTIPRLQHCTGKHIKVKHDGSDWTGKHIMAKHNCSDPYALNTA